jgi:NAD(P)-dependent dehydrogenase (short-subunit alcohol dehydrogenase family)
MLTSVLEKARSVHAYKDLVGKRVLLTGLTGGYGIDVARAFAEHRCRLILQFAEDSEATQAIAEIMAPVALEVEIYGPIGPEPDDAVTFGRAAVQAFGGLDAVVNLVAIAPRQLDERATPEAVEAQVADLLRLPYLLANIAANRMALTMTEGVVLNVAMLPGCAGDGLAHTFALVARTALAAMTRAQAEAWAGRAIRFNAIAPGSTLSAAPWPEPDIAALALYLASAEGALLSGHLFEADTACR